MSNQTVENLKKLMESVSPKDVETVEKMRPLYSEQVRFEDPVQLVQGVDHFIAANRRLVEMARVFKFVVHDAAQTQTHGFLSWTMEWATRWTPVTHLEGVSRLRLHDGKIVDQRDYWDSVEGALGTIPKVLTAYKRFNGRWMSGKKAHVGARA
jgi:hypothetical protein